MSDLSAADIAEGRRLIKARPSDPVAVYEWLRKNGAALLDAAEKLDRATDLFEKWAAEESEHRAAGDYGIAEGLHVAIEELRYAVHGTYEKPYPDGLRERQREPEEVGQ